jgi:putative ATP-dependent endonuclease of OLD family
MYVSNLKLWNFRKYGSEAVFDLATPHLNLDFKPTLNILVGENDAGKSAIIDALKIIFKTHSFEWIKVQEDDFYKTKSRLRIEVVLQDLNEFEAKNFIEWLGWNGEGEEATPYLRLILDVTRNPDSGDIKYYDVKAGIDDEGTILSADAREKLKTTYLRPLRDAVSELVPRQNSRLSQILQGHHAFKDKQRNHLLVDIFDRFNNEITQYFLGKDADSNDIPDQDGKALKTEIDKYIEQFYNPDSESLFDVSKGTLKNILERLELSLKDTINPGLGTLNKLFISSELLNLKKGSWSGLRLGLIEELEAHLHPQSQMKVMQHLQEIEGIQLILTTHSPNLASKVNLENLIVCNGNQVYPMSAEYTKLSKYDYKYLEKFLDVTKADMFFAKGLILVEGTSEEVIIPSLAKKIGIDLVKKGVSVINVGNLGFSHYTNIFLRKNAPLMNIPVAVVTDSDVRPFYLETKIEGGEVIATPIDQVKYETARDLKIEQIESKSEANVAYFTSKDWTLEYCLANSSSLSDAFKAVTKIVHPQIDWATNFNQELAKRLMIKKGIRKSEIAYKLAFIIDAENKKNISPGIQIDLEDEADKAKYLFEAIKYASRN